MAEADSLGRSEVRVSLNGAELGTLVRPRRYFGTMHQLAVEWGANAPLCYVAPEKNVLGFEMPDDAIYQNGIVILATATEEDLAGGAMPMQLQLRLRSIDQIDDHRNSVGETATEY